MSDGERKMDELLERAIRETRADAAPADEAAAARRRAWQRIAGADAEGDACGRFRTQIPSFLDGSLDSERRWLLEAHLNECARCRVARDARQGAPATMREAAATQADRPSRLAWLRPALAAAAVLAVVAAAGFVTQGSLPSGLVEPATIADVDGGLYRIAGGTSEPAQPGAALRAGEAVRTGKESGAVLTLADGSRLEIAPRSELAYGAGWRDTVFRLRRGSVIVEAADQGLSRLFVRTGDCDVAVKGTVFSVTTALKGSRVSVLEGEVHVHSGRGTSVLIAGDQMTTRASMPAVPFTQEIGWSRNVDEHLALMKELVALGKELERVPRPGLRYDAPLLDLVPGSTIVYVGIPNLADTLEASYAVVRERVASNEVLDRWWQENVVETGAEPELDEAIARLVELGDALGDEIVVALTADSGEEGPRPLVLAELVDEDALVGLIEREMTGAPVRLVRGPAPSGGGEGLEIWVHGGLVAASPDPAALRALAAVRGADGPGPFSGTPLRARLAESYRDGAGLVVGADLGRILGEAADGAGGDGVVLEQLGILDARHLIVERKRVDGRTTSQATVWFDGPRRGLAAWVAPPAPMGALDFVSPEAHLAAGFVVSDPAALVRELFSSIEAGDADFATQLDRFEEEAGIRIIEDIAAPLGGELAFALDGPVLPTPAWRLVVEVYDAQRLQQTIAWAVDRVNGELEAAGEAGQIELAPSRIAGREGHVLRGTGAAVAIHYVFADGYLVAAPKPALVERALRARASGYVLTASPAFRELLPPGGPDNFSAVVYQSLGSLIGPLAGTFGVAGGLSEEQQGVLRELAEESRGSLTYAYGLEDRIVIASSGQGPLSGELGGLLGLGGLANVRRAMSGAIGGSLEADPGADSY